MNLDTDIYRSQHATVMCTRVQDEDMHAMLAQLAWPGPMAITLQIGSRLVYCSRSLDT